MNPSYKNDKNYTLTEDEIFRFKKMLSDGMDAAKEAAKEHAKNNGQKKDYKEKKVEYYIVLRNVILKFFWADILYGAAMALICETLALSYNYIIKDLIYYIKFGENETTEG